MTLNTYYESMKHRVWQKLCGSETILVSQPVWSAAGLASDVTLITFPLCALL